MTSAINPSEPQATACAVDRPALVLGFLVSMFLSLFVLCGAARAQSTLNDSDTSSLPDSTQTVQQALQDASDALSRGNGSDALEGLRAIEVLEPDNPWAWYFRGQAHRQLGEPYRAMEAYDRALDELAAAGNPEPELIERIKVNRQAARRQVFNLSFQTGLAYDSNVTFTGDGASTEFISGRGDGKFATQFQADYVPFVTNEEAVTFGIRLQHAWHFSIEEFNFQNYGGYARYTRRLDDHWTFDARFDTDLSYLDNEPFSSIHALSPRLTYRWDPREAAVAPRETAIFYRLEARDYLFHTSSSFDRDGFVNAFGVEQSLRLRPLAAHPEWTCDAFAGYQFQSVATEGSEFDRLGNDVYVGLDVPMKNPLLDGKALTARFLARVEMDDYRNRSRFDRRRRERDDVITTLGVVVSQTLIEDPQDGDLILHGIFNWTDSDSNVQTREFAAPFSYDKIVAGFQLEWRF